MSEFFVPVVRVGEITKHPNADALGLTRVFDYPVVVRLGDFQPGDLAVYVPVDAIVPADDPRWEFLQGHRRIKAKRLRGIFSMGLLVALPRRTFGDGFWAEGQDIREALRIEKYEPPEPFAMGGENEKDPGFLPVYTDIEGLRRWPDLLRDGEEVLVTEKLHGCCSRFLWRGDRLWVGSHKCIKRENADNLWWKVAHGLGLADKLATVPSIAFYGEVYGQVQDLKYGVPKGEVARLALFDALDTNTRRYLDVDEFHALADRLNLRVVPRLYRGPWKPELRGLAEGTSTMLDAHHVREGIVIRPVVERFDERVGRVILKLHGEDYLTRKDV